jgi:cold shock protein
MPWRARPTHHLRSRDPAASPRSPDDGFRHPRRTLTAAFGFEYGTRRDNGCFCVGIEDPGPAAQWKWRRVMAVGKVKWFNDEKGWGFIKQDEGPDVFVHYSQIGGEGRRRLFEDELVEFEIKEGPKGLQAVNVMRPQGADASS